MKNLPAGGVNDNNAFFSLVYAVINAIKIVLLSQLELKLLTAAISVSISAIVRFDIFTIIV